MNIRTYVMKYCPLNNGLTLLAGYWARVVAWMAIPGTEFAGETGSDRIVPVRGWRSVRVLIN